jgi:GT2 family glycosyltransferase
MNPGVEQKPLPVPAVRVLVVIVNYKTAELTRKCLQSLVPEVARDGNFRVVVVENDSGDGSALCSMVEQNGWSDWASVTLAERNGGFSYGNNRGIEPALRWPQPPDYFLLLNSDTEVRAGAISTLVEFMDKHPAVGIAGSSFENPDGSEWPIAFRFPSLASQLEQGMRFGPVTRLLRNSVQARTMGRETAQVDWVAGASMMLRRQVVNDIGLMDERYFLYFEEVDYCLQARRAGWPCWYVPQSRVMHIAGQSTGVSSDDRKLRRMPDYWFASRSRYFVKNHGLTYARLADLAFGLGLLFWTIRIMISGRESSDPKGFLADFWRKSVIFRSRAAVLQRIGGLAGE